MTRKPRLDKTKRYYWHLSGDGRLGAGEYTFAPYIEGISRNDSEPKVSRFCVATTPAGCFVAVPLGNSVKPYFLYRTKRKVHAHYTYHVPDSSVTGERWRLRKSKYVLISRFNGEQIYEFNKILLSECESRRCSDDIGSGDRRVLAAQLATRMKIEAILNEMQIK